MGRKAGAGIWGPYHDRSGWYLRQRTADGGTARVAVESEASGRRIIAEARRQWEAHGRTVGAAVDAYGDFLRDEKRNKPKSYNETLRRLRLFFADVDAAPLGELTPMRAKALYQALTKRIATAPTAGTEDAPAPIGGTRAPTGRPISVDYCRNTLIEARSFLRYCVDRGWVTRNALDGVKGLGKRKHGKAQLRVDEARAWLAHAMAKAPAPGAVAALCTIVLGLRATEITSRQARDIDDGGRILWIEETSEGFEAKTNAGRRYVEVDEELRPHLLALAKGKASTDLLFGRHWRDWPREQVQAICEAVGVPKVTAHGMRGLRATLGILGGLGAMLRATATALGHDKETTTAQSYIAPGTIEKARGRAALAVLRGGRHG